MTIEKLPSGSYRIKQMYEGKYYSITVDYKPTKKDAASMIAEKLLDKKEKKPKMPFTKAATEYTSSKDNVLSPRTIREYGLYPDRLPEWFTKLSVYEITQTDVQRCINELSKDKSPKTVRCLHGFISAVLTMFQPNMVLHTSLPQKVLKEPYIPTNDEVIKLLNYTRENAPYFYVPIFLGGYSIRRSELLALTPADIDDDGFLHINKAKVQDKNGEWVIKTTKTVESTRTIPLPPELITAINEQGYIYDMAPQSISNYMRRTQAKLGMQKFSLHKMRHYCCSRLIEMGYSFKDAQVFCGWKTDTTPRAIYTHSLKMRNDEEKRKISDALSAGMF